jgi:hypothetical protein
VSLCSVVETGGQITIVSAPGAYQGTASTQSWLTQPTRTPQPPAAGAKIANANTIPEDPN